MSHQHITRRMFGRKAAAMLLAGTVSPLSGVASAQTGALVIDGEEIASAELFSQARTEGTLVLYSGYFEYQERELLAAFTKDSGIPVKLLTLSGGTLIERVLSEHGAGKLDADLIRLTDPSYQQRMRGAGIQLPHKVPGWDRIPAELKDPDGYYMASFLSMVVFGYNTNLVTPANAPKSWQDLLLPAWAGQKIGTWDINAGGSPWGIALVQRQKWGIDFWKKFAAQNIRFFPQGAPAAEEVARGEIPLTVNGLEALVAVIKNGAPISIAFPQDGVIVIPHYLTLTTASKRQAASKVFANWCASLRGAKVAAGAGAYTSNPDAPAIVLDGKPLPRPRDINIIVPNPQDFINLRKDWITEWRAIFKR